MCVSIHLECWLDKARVEIITWTAVGVARQQQFSYNSVSKHYERDRCGFNSHLMCIRCMQIQFAFNSHLKKIKCERHSNNSPMIRYTQLSVQDAHTVTVLPVLRLAKSA